MHQNFGVASCYEGQKSEKGKWRESERMKRKKRKPRTQWQAGEADHSLWLAGRCSDQRQNLTNCWLTCWHCPSACNIQHYFFISSQKSKCGWTLTTSQYTITHNYCIFKNSKNSYWKYKSYIINNLVIYLIYTHTALTFEQIYLFRNAVDCRTEICSWFLFDLGTSVKALLHHGTMGTHYNKPCTARTGNISESLVASGHLATSVKAMVHQDMWQHQWKPWCIKTPGNISESHGASGHVATSVKALLYHDTWQHQWKPWCIMTPGNISESLVASGHVATSWCIMTPGNISESLVASGHVATSVKAMVHQDTWQHQWKPCCITTPGNISESHGASWHLATSVKALLHQDMWQHHGASWHLATLVKALLHQDTWQHQWKPWCIRTPGNISESLVASGHVATSVKAMVHHDTWQHQWKPWCITTPWVHTTTGHALLGLAGIAILWKIPEQNSCKPRSCGGGGCVYGGGRGGLLSKGVGGWIMLHNRYQAPSLVVLAEFCGKVLGATTGSSRGCWARDVFCGWSDLPTFSRGVAGAHFGAALFPCRLFSRFCNKRIFILHEQGQSLLRIQCVQLRDSVPSVHLD